MKNEKTKKKVVNHIPEDDPELVYRIYNVISYFVVLVIIGIPIWWYTTRVFRANLPFDRIYNVELANKTDKHFGIPLSLNYDILITIVNPDPSNLEVDIKGEDIEASLEPFLTKLTSVADFSVKSQWLYLTELGAFPRKVLDHYVLTEEQLPHVITPLEKKLWSHLTQRPCLNLVLYVSPCNVPLYIYDKENQRTSNAFLSPRWGGIYIVNPATDACNSKTFQPDLASVATVFTTQITKMLQMSTDSEEEIKRLQLGKTTDMIHSTRRTLKSLAELLHEINSIVISDDVANRINLAVDNADIADEFLKKNDIESALKFAKIAFENSEAAFSDPSLLALLYFPDDQKYAVYIPLFLPVMIPVFMSLITVKKWYKGKQKVD